MLISLKHRLAFLAVPTTGTTAIEDVLRKHAQIVFRQSTKLKHTPAQLFETHLRPYLDSIGAEGVQTLAVMREPLDQLLSWYFYRNRLGEGTKPEKQAHSTSGITLEQFLEGYLSDDPPDYADIGSQAVFLCGKKQMKNSTGAAVVPLVDIIFPYERLDDALRFVSERLGETMEIERKNISKRAEVEIAPDLLARLKARLAPDIALYARVQAGEFLPDSPHATARAHQAGKAGRKARRNMS